MSNSDIVDLWMPYPPSVNSYYRRNGFATYISSKGKHFKREVAEEVSQQLPGIRLEGPLEMLVTLYPPHINRRRDLDNCLKILQDSITESNLWHDDDQVVRVSAEWGPVDSKLNSKGGCANVKIRRLQD